MLLAQTAQPGAPPLGVEDKFLYHAKRFTKPTEFVRAAVSAGFQQFNETPKEWGQGAEGFGRRYASSLGANILRQSFTFALDSTLREDPRYFLSTKTTFKDRAKNALVQTLVCHTDRGGRSFAFARVGAAFGSELASNTWRPRSVDTTGDAMVRAASTLAVSAGTNLFREYQRDIRRWLKH